MENNQNLKFSNTLNFDLISTEDIIEYGIIELLEIVNYFNFELHYN